MKLTRFVVDESPRKVFAIHRAFGIAIHRSGWRALRVSDFAQTAAA
jgi:hypothetical protein